MVMTSSGKIAGLTKNRYSNSFFDKLYELPIPYSITSKIIPVDYVITGIEFKNKKFDSEILSEPTTTLELEDLAVINAGITDKNSHFLKKHSKLIKLNLNQKVSQVSQWVL